LHTCKFHADLWNPLACARVTNKIISNEYGPQMTNTERTKPYGSTVVAHAADDIASKGAAAFRDAKAGVEGVIADAGEKGQQALNYAGKKGQEAMDNVRGVGDTLAIAIDKSVTTRPYTTLALAVAAGFLFGAIWRRST
jgi:ElaB/YqjD/DUF883 family membrane-anchored ribosome-binding protein